MLTKMAISRIIVYINQKGAYRSGKASPKNSPSKVGFTVFIVGKVQSLYRFQNKVDSSSDDKAC